MSTSTTTTAPQEFTISRNYIIKQLSLKEAKEQYPQQYERSI